MPSANQPELTRDQPRLSFTIGHALAVILLLIVALGISLALLVQQSMNMAMLSSTDRHADHGRLRWRSDDAIAEHHGRETHGSAAVGRS